MRPPIALSECCSGQSCRPERSFRLLLSIEMSSRPENDSIAACPALLVVPSVPGLA